MDRKTQLNLAYLLIAVFGVLMLQSLFSTMTRVEAVPYSEFQQRLKNGEISEVEISEDAVKGTLKNPQPGKTQYLLANRVAPELIAELDAAGVKYYQVHESGLLRTLASWVIPLLLFYAVWMFAFRKMADKQGMGGLLSIGKSRAKVFVETDTKVTFADVAGVDEAKAELQEIVNFLKDPQGYGRLGARLPKGILLVGPPGTGKTLLARAVAGEAGVPFFSISGSEFVEMFVGVGAARVRDLFEHAREKAPAIIFIDELDALGRARGATPWGGHDEKEQTLNQLLSEMDGFDPRQGLVLLAATNRPEILDPALLRAGRFDRQVLVDRPDKRGRLQILKVHIGKVKLAEGVDLGEIAAMTPGFSGADLANLVNEAALLATRRGADTVTTQDFGNAVERIVAGLEKKNRLLNPKERRVVAYHELGHAFVAMSLSGTDPVHKVSIIPRGIGALGYTIQRPTDDRYLMSRVELENKMAVLLGGRASEACVFGEISTGAADDLVKATDIARSMVTRYGMTPELGQVAYENGNHPFLDTPEMRDPERRYSEDTARKIDQAVQALVDGAYQRALTLLRSERAALDRAAEALLAKETLLEAELATYLHGGDAAAPSSAAAPAPASPPAGA
ncbi:ATP-dependent zinc metalloprotease FtsH [Solimonas variicoloris]|uniref:ATP-dependent zinc metalloprotease FtsH n=1 Tax=Solimonas variicoloris TaxID=254408 RepID=UPI0003626EBF|nr:ATP-dependent zinc metalloprotease FtsH [Solimonas variicoloris]